MAVRQRAVRGAGLDVVQVLQGEGAVLKYREDQEKVRQQGGIADIVKQAFERGAFHV